MAETVKLHVRTGDKVLVLSGKEKGREGKIIKAIPKIGKVVVEGLNKVKRHSKPSQANPQGGIVIKEAAMSSSKVMLVCPACNKATRIQKSLQADGTFARTCKKCKEVVDKQK